MCPVVLSLVLLPPACYVNQISVGGAFSLASKGGQSKQTERLYSDLIREIARVLRPGKVFHCTVLYFTALHGISAHKAPTASTHQALWQGWVRWMRTPTNGHLCVPRLAQCSLWCL